MKGEIEKFIQINSKLFEKRIQENKIRECHGDLHSENIFITDKIFIFDALEFNKRFSCSDVAAEVGFLAMDLDLHSREDLSKFFVEKYIEYSQDTDLPKLLSFYKCYRAYVRGKINSFKLNDKNISKDDKASAKKIAQKYFDLAYKCAKEMN